MKQKTLFVALLVMANFVFSQNTLWQKQSRTNNTLKGLSKFHLESDKVHYFTLNSDSFRQTLVGAPLRGRSTSSNVVVTVPGADGKLESFTIYEAPVFTETLSARYPNIKSYVGFSVNNSGSKLRMSVSPQGVQTMISYLDKESVFVMPTSHGSNEYLLYNKSSRGNYIDEFECTTIDELTNEHSYRLSNEVARDADDQYLRTYRLAVSVNGEYTTYHGGTVAGALAAINATITRVNAVFETDMAITFQLIDADQLIYTNASTDPYSNSLGNWNVELQNTLTNTIGNAAYDIGHMFGASGGGGNAGCIGCVCEDDTASTTDENKGAGITSPADGIPEGDNFDIDYVAHEIGHQMGANHTWAFNTEGTGVNAEPGSGSTIMGYAGITGANNVQQHSDDYFHYHSINQILNNVATAPNDCAVLTGISNNPPSANAGPNYTIPQGTAYVLEGSATDPDGGDSLTYCWEQIDSGQVTNTTFGPTLTSGSMNRSLPPSSSPDRYIPNLDRVVNNQLTQTNPTINSAWETVATVGRTMNWALTVRDREPTALGLGGQSSFDLMTLTTVASAGPFVVNIPNTNVTWNANTFQTVTWDVAGTTGNGVNAANVDIFLSTDGGYTYPITLATDVANDGSHDIAVPNNQGTTNRIMVKASDNIFFDISNTNFTIGAPVTCNATTPTNFASSNVGSTTATLSWDAITYVVFDVQYREVGSGTWIDASTSGTSIDLSGLTPETNYEAQVRSRCPDSSTSAYTSIINFTTIAIPPCIGAQITSYPYLETFNSGIGDWTQGTGDDGNWTLDASGTPTSLTGPSNDITGGGNYYYLEGNSFSTNDEIYFESPCFDLTSLSRAFFTFNYHMYGSVMGTLNVDITVDNGTNWTNLFTLNGDQGNSWNEETLDLSSYVGSTVKIRFTGIRGSGNRSDMAIDHISLSEDPTYCASNGNDISDEHISRVQLASIDNSSGAGAGGYTDFTAVSTVLYGGQSYTITITPTWTPTVYSEGYAVWIDYNKNGDFNDAGELVFTQTPTQNTSVSGNFTVPLDVVYEGTTRMRVSLMYNAVPSSCGTFAYGEVEDYTIDLQYDGLLYSNNTWTPSAPSSSTGADNVLIQNGVYNVSSSIAVNDFNIISGASIDVAEGNSVEINGDLNNDGELTLNSTSNSYSSLIVNGTSTGSVKYKRHVNAFNGTTGNDLISAPLSGQTFGAFTLANSNIYENPSSITQKLFGPFNKTTGSYQTYDSSSDSALVLDSGIGFRAARDASEDGASGTTFTFEGNVETGNVNTSILSSGPAYAVWNLIGNPYPSFINLSDFLTANSGQFLASSTAVYGYDGNTSDGWVVWNQAYSLANPNAVITPGQGFFVASKAGGGTISFTPSMRDAGFGDDFINGRSSNNTSISHLELELSTSNNNFNTNFYFTDNATLGMDAGYDSSVYGELAPSFALYSRLVQDDEGVDMAIQSMSLNDFNNNVAIPLGINANQGEQITISIFNTTLPQGTDVYLEDRDENTFILLTTNDFVTTLDSNLNGTGRFYLHVNQSALSLDTNEIETLYIYNTLSPKTLYVKGLLQNKAEMNVYDIQGRLMFNTNLSINTQLQSFNISNLTTGVYLVSINNEFNSITKKIIVK